MANFIFRLDSNLETGLGHLARCSYLATLILEKGMGKVYFCIPGKILKPSFLSLSNIQFVDPGNGENGLMELLLSLSGKKVLFFDSYKIDEKIEQLIYPLVDYCVVIDDLANRKHWCDLLIDCGPHRKKSDYFDLVPRKAKVLTGLDYCFISEQMKKVKNTIPSEKGRAHIFFGGGVQNLFVINFLSEFKRMFRDFSFNVAFSRILSIDDQSALNKIVGENDNVFVEKVLADSLAGCSFAIGSPGIATWERCYLGIPSFYISTNPNQVAILLKLEELGVSKYVGSVEEDVNVLVKKVSDCDLNSVVSTIRHRIEDLVDGNGAERILRLVSDI